nr:substrate-binding domain-containing protein [Lachnospiraceae bacterium]
AMLMNTCIKKGIRVPEDLSIMGFDDNQNRRLCRPELTTMHQDIEKKGVTAAQRLIDMIHGEIPKEHQIVMTSELVERESVRDMTATAE